MPELVNSSVGSLPGTNEAEGTMVWPLPRKNSRKSLRILLLLSLGVVIWLGIWRAGTSEVPRYRQDADACWSRQPNPQRLTGRDGSVLRVAPQSRPDRVA